MSLAGMATEEPAEFLLKVEDAWVTTVDTVVGIVCVKVVNLVQERRAAELWPRATPAKAATRARVFWNCILIITEGAGMRTRRLRST